MPSISQRKGHPRFCVVCGQSFYRQPSHMGLCCSRKCANVLRILPVETFWSRIDRSGGPDACWLWQGTTNRDGYGTTGKRYGLSSTALAHRVAWELTNGPIRPGYSICHKCDNPPCCNPAHLFEGTTADNRTDQKIKGRTLKGESNPRARLTNEQAREIRARYAAGGISQYQLAREYGIAVMNINHIVRGLAYAE